ncbi:MAG: leucine--tRNA ligase [Phycisphaerales bacterium]|nr:leucine--tRNA ligase [Phycisphaerales bacterium]
MPEANTQEHRYTPELADRIERRWQQRWDEAAAFRALNPGDKGFDGSRPKFYCLDMFPYPSGAGLHVGHPEGYTATDILSRMKRMQGFNVLHPMGWDAFGLPAEQYAIQTGVHPAVTTKKAIDNFRRQLKRFGFSYDWSREFATIDPDYYKWTQWIWLRAYSSWYDTDAQRARPIDELIQLLENGKAYVNAFGELSRTQDAAPLDALGGGGGGAVGHRKWHELEKDERREFIDSMRLAYIGEQTVNWCPKLGTVLANEEVIDGRSERGGHPVVRRPLRQWMFRITAYAQRLLDDLDGLDWPTSTRTQQSEWIGRSQGAEVDFQIDGALGEEFGSIRVFTTRPDTIYGATYMVVAPEHPLVDAVLERGGAEAKAIRSYVEAARNRADVDRQADNKEKTGVALGVSAINPLTGGKIPVWTSDYVLMGYGHGAIMAVPAHDQRDFDFAEAFSLPIVDVVYPRQILALRFFTANATAEERESELWRTRLADFMGLMTSGDARPDEFERILGVVRQRRREVSTNDPAATQEKQKPGGVGTKRGVTQMLWHEFIDDLGFKSFDALKACMERGGFYQHEGGAFEGEGYAVNSDVIDGLPTKTAKATMIEHMQREGIGRGRVNFKLRDWLFSRQRYWGEPFPVVFDQDGNHYPVSEKALPVLLPELSDYKPGESQEPRPLLGNASDWMRTTARDAGVREDVLAPNTKVVRELNTMPGWAGSCWYYLRYIDPKNPKRFVGTDAERYWMQGGGVDLYIGGNEHAVLHLLYARFWHKMLFDLGEVSTREPFAKLFHQGLILSHAYQRGDGSLVPVDEVDERAEGEFVERAMGSPVKRIIAKMSKSLRNVVNPDDVIAEFGADTFRLYEMYMGPLESSKPWNTKDMVGLFRFLQRAWRLIVDEATGDTKFAGAPDARVEKLLHRTIAKVGQDVEKLAFNTAIAAMIEFVNASTNSSGLTRDQSERFALMLCPFAPHIAEEMWERLGKTDLCSLATWPSFDEAMLKDDEVELAVQVNGKVRAKIMVPADADQKRVESLALGHEKIAAAMEGKPARKVIVVPGRLVNIITG